MTDDKHSRGSAAPETGTAAAPVSVPAVRPASNVVAWLAILLVIAVAMGLFYLMLDLQRRETALLQRVQSLESLAGQDDTSLDQMRDNLRRQLELEIEGIQARQERADEDLQRSLKQQEQALARLESRPQAAAPILPDIDAILATQVMPLKQALEEQNQALAQQSRTLADQQMALREQRGRINSLTIDDRESWQLAEAQYLLRLANQRLIMTRDAVSAEALLSSTDDLLRELDNADLHDLRAAVASDLAAVRSVPKLDIQGLYLRLDALIRQTDALVMFALPQRDLSSSAPLESDWKTRLVNGYDLALEKLSEYIVISRRDIPVEALMDPQYEGLVRQNMRMLLEQAQMAMLSGNERLFQQSLERAAQWVSQFFKADEQAAVAMREELTAISVERIRVDLPDLATSLQALDTLMRVRLARDGTQ